MANFNRLVDTLTDMKAAALVAASAADTVIVDFGGNGFMKMDLVIDVTAIEIDTNDELFTVVFQLSPDSDFGTAANIQDGAAISIGSAGGKATDSDKDDTIGRYILPVTNEVNGTVYQYARLYTVVAGTVATGINYSAFLTKLNTGRAGGYSDSTGYSTL